MFQPSKNIPELQTGFPITQAVIDGSQSGRIYDYDGNFFIIHKAGFCSLIKKGECLEELIGLLYKNQIPQYFHIYDPQENLVNRVQNDSEIFNYKIRNRIQLTYERKEPVNVPEVKDFYYEDVCSSNFGSLSVFNLDLDRRFWNSDIDFIRAAYGVIVFDGRGEPASLCYAAAVTQNKAEIDVITLEKFRGRGLAKLSVAAFINKCLRSDLIPNWDCFVDNTASYKTAISLGFESLMTYKFLSVFKKTDNEYR